MRDYSNKSQSKKQFQHGVRTDFSLQYLRYPSIPTEQLPEYILPLRLAPELSPWLPKLDSHCASSLACSSPFNLL